MKLTSNEWLCDAGRRWTQKPAFLILMTGVLWLAPIQRARAAVSTTTVQGTVYHLADGQPGSGMLHVRWPSFTSANGQAIVADSIDVTIGEDGFLSVNLAANQGAMPGGLYYTAVFYMSDGSVSTQYRWRYAAQLFGIFDGIVYQSAVGFLSMTFCCYTGLRESGQCG